MNASCNSTPAKGGRTSVIIDSRPSSSYNECTKMKHVGDAKHLESQTYKYVGDRTDLDGSTDREDIYPRSIDIDMGEQMVRTKHGNRADNGLYGNGIGDSYEPPYVSVHKHQKNRISNPWTPVMNRSNWRGASEPPGKKDGATRNGQTGMLDTSTSMYQDSISVLEEVEEVLRSSLRLCIRHCATKFIPSNLSWLLNSHGIPIEGSVNGDIWLDVQVRIVRVTLRGECSYDHPNRSNRISRPVTDGIELEITTPSIPEGSRFCLVSIIDPHTFRRMQADQRITVDWTLFPGMIGDMLHLCHRNATQDPHLDEPDIYMHDGSARGSANRPMSSYTSGNHLCILSGSEDKGALELSIIESSTLREIVHLWLPMKFAQGAILEQHLVRLYIEMQEENVRRTKEYHELLESSRERESHYQRLENIRTSATSQKMTSMERENAQMKELIKELRTAVTEAEVKANENIVLVLESRTNKENAEKYKESMSMVEEENRSLVDQNRTLSSEVNRLRDTLKSLEPEAVEDLRRVAITQKSLLAECELELANHTQIYNSLNNKIQALHAENAKLKSRAEGLEFQLNEKYAAGDLDNKKLSTLNYENQQLKEEVEELTRQAGVHAKNIANYEHQLKAKSALIEYLHKELNRVSAGVGPPPDSQKSPQITDISNIQKCPQMPEIPNRVPSHDDIDLVKENRVRDPLKFMKNLSNMQSAPSDTMGGVPQSNEIQNNLAKSFNWSQLWQKK